MQPTTPGRTAGRLRRTGPLALLVIVVVAAVVAVALGDGGEGSSTSDGGDDPGNGEVGAPSPTGEMPPTYAEASEADTLEDRQWPDACDRELGTVRLPSVYALPCVPEFQGDNGGATSPGVTADTIRVVRYMGDESSDLTALLGSMGVDETREDVTSTFDDYLELYASVVETYGRRFEIIEFDATGAADDEVASRADAETIASEYEPFAVLGGPALDSGAFAEELAGHGILCFGCGLAMPDGFMQEHAPFIWGTSPSPEQHLQTLAAWVNQADDAAVERGTPEEANKAIFAGDESYHERERVIGVIHFEQDPPIFEETAAEQQQSFEVAYRVRETYLFDFATMPQRATELIAKMKEESVTTILFLGDPIMPIYLTQEATRQEYFPEWIFTGTALTDSNVMARQWDQRQMGAAFGLSNLAAPTDQAIQDPWRIYKWYFGQDAEPAAASQYALIAPGPAWLVAGVHMAGPELTPETFARGLFRIPPRGGGPTTAQVSFGSWGFFEDPDYFGIDDSVEIWWDPEAEGPDEIGREGAGLWRRSNGAQRFTAADAPMPNPFVVEGSVLVFDELPPEDTPPEYQPPPGSPAAGD